MKSFADTLKAGDEHGENARKLQRLILRIETVLRLPPGFLIPHVAEELQSAIDEARKP